MYIKSTKYIYSSFNRRVNFDRDNASECRMETGCQANQEAKISSHINISSHRAAHNGQFSLPEVQ